MLHVARAVACLLVLGELDRARVVDEQYRGLLDVDAHLAQQRA